MKKTVFGCLFAILLLIPSGMNSSSVRKNRLDTTKPSHPIIDNLCHSTFADIWQQDHVFISESKGIPIDWAIYVIHPSAGENPQDLRAKIIFMHDQNRLYIHYLQCNVWHPNGHFSSVPEMMNYKALDIDGNAITTRTGDGFTRYSMDLLEPGWKEFMKQEIKRVVDAGGDGILFDDIQTHILSILPPHGGNFRRPNIEGFRNFLKLVYSPADLQSKFGISSIDQFDYQQYILSRGFRNLWKTEPWKVPLYNQFLTFEFRATLQVYKEIIDWAKEYAQTHYHRNLIFMGNTSNGLEFGLPFESNLDISLLEYHYSTFGYPPLGKVLPSSKVKTDSRPKKGTYQTSVATSSDLQARGDLTNIVKVFLAEAYSSQCEFQVPVDVPATRGGYNPNLSLLEPYYSFIKKHADLFSADSGWKSKIALFYVDATYHCGVAKSYSGAALALFDAGYQFDTIFSGDGWSIPNTLSPADLQRYPYLFLGDTYLMSLKEVHLLIDYVRSGGTLVCWGRVGEGDEFGDETTFLPNDWKKIQQPGAGGIGQGRYINLSRADIGGQYYTGRDAASRNALLSPLTSAGLVPEITPISSAHKNMLIYHQPTFDRVILHVINYAYNLATDSIDPLSNFQVRFKLPENFQAQGKKLILISPDFAETQELSAVVENGVMIATIPQLHYYDILVLSEWVYPPKNISVFRVNRSFLSREKTDFITWEHDERNSSIVAYRIYRVTSREKTLIAEVGGNLKAFWRRLDLPSGSRIGVAAVNSSGIESSISVNQ